MLYLVGVRSQNTKVKLATRRAVFFTKLPCPTCDRGEVNHKAVMNHSFAYFDNISVFSRALIISVSDPSTKDIGPDPHMCD